MEAFKQALMKALQEAKAGGKKPMPGDDEAYDGDAIDSEKERAKSDLAPELKDEPSEDDKAELAMEGQEQKEELRHHGAEEGILQQILSALSDGADNQGRPPMGLKERAAANAKAKLNSMKK